LQLGVEEAFMAAGFDLVAAVRGLRSSGSPDRPYRHRALDLTGAAPGTMDPRSWVRSARGMWLALCKFPVACIDGRKEKHMVGWQLVPADGLRQATRRGYDHDRSLADPWKRHG
jgi:hypothetical protein